MDYLDIANKPNIVAHGKMLRCIYVTVFFDLG